MAKGNTQSVISLLPRDRTYLRFGNCKTLSKYRDELLNNGILTQHRAPLYGRMTRKGNAGYIGCKNLTFIVNFTSLILLTILRAVCVVMSRVFDWSKWQAAISPLLYSAGIICIWTDL